MKVKLASILPVVGTVLYLFATGFFLYAINHPEAGFSLSLAATYIFYFSYLATMFLSLVIGCILLWMKGFSNRRQRLGGILFLLGVILHAVFMMMICLIYFLKSIELYVLADFGLYFSIFSWFACPILFVIGLVLSRYGKLE